MSNVKGSVSMLIGQVSELTGATRKAIRHYESIGLIQPPQRKGDYRIYSQNDVAVISMIRRAQALGFNLKELKNIVSKKENGKDFPVEMATDLIDNKVLTLEKEIEELLLKNQQLKQLKLDLIKQFA